MPWPKGQPHTKEMVQARIKAQTKWGWLPEQEIVDRLLETDATVRQIAAEYGCSKSTIDKIFRRHATKAQRLEAKHRKQGASLKGHKFNRLRKPLDPQVLRARTAVSNAVRDGHLTRPLSCQHPTGEHRGRIEAHHWKGYDDEHLLDVVWLCRIHHEFAESKAEIWLLEFEPEEA